jgi:hypothetical protein
VEDHRELKKAHDQMWALIQQYRRQFGAISDIIRKTVDVSAGAVQLVSAKTPVRAQQSPQPKRPQPIPAASSKTPDGISALAHKILTVLYRHGQSADPKFLALRSGYTVNGHFKNELGALRAAGLVVDNPVRLTPEGQQWLAEHGSADLFDDPQQYWLAKLPASSSRILANVLAAYPGDINIQDLASASGYTVNGHFKNLVGELRGKGLITRGNPVKAAEELFI